jgi:hypothetical protein
VARVDDFVPGIDVILIATGDDNGVGAFGTRTRDPCLSRPVDQSFAQCPPIPKGRSDPYAGNLTMGILRASGTTRPCEP